MAPHATLPPLRGRVQQGAPLAPFTWFRVGGPAEWLVRPADVDDLLLLLRDLPDAMPLTVLGAASNLIIRDGGLRGVVLRLGGRGFGEVTVEADGIVAGAAALDAVVAEHAATAGLAGLEFLCGIPGSLGGAVAMNAGAYGREIVDVLDWAEVATPAGLLRLSAAELHFAYRHATLPPRGVVVRARLRATPGDATMIAAEMTRIRMAREATQPVRARTGGSTFKNPPGAEGLGTDRRGPAVAAWRSAAAQVSELHTQLSDQHRAAPRAADLEAPGRGRFAAACARRSRRRAGMGDRDASGSAAP
jgi:UDP-N-acetylmuramate dehydrogenase